MMSQILLVALEDRWRNYCVQLKRCRTRFSNDAVHDVRVALRRLLALIRLLDSVLPRPRLRKLERAFKDQLDDFDDLRDTQVLLDEISKVRQEFPQLEQLQDHLKTDEKGLLNDLRGRIKKFKCGKVKRGIRKTRKSLKDEIKTDLTSPILRSVDEAFLVTKKRLGRVNPSQPASIHRVRVAFKKFRYKVEIVHPLLKDFPEENFKPMNDYQSMMGRIQDLEIIMRTLSNFSLHASSFDVEPVSHFYEARRVDAISAFIQNKDMLDDFWRESPEHHFPWEVTA